ncbi:MAG: hypothetical protein ACI841_004656 [Planctomycetota bacterium]|jgi:hypothetical protein
MNDRLVHVLINDYREMFGRRRLAWEPALQLATEWHAAYMEKEKLLGHIQEGD